MTGGAEVAGEAVGATGTGVLGLGGGTVGVGLLGALWGLLVPCNGLLEVLGGLLGVVAHGGESISMSEGSSLLRENSPFQKLMVAMLGSYTWIGGTDKTLDLLLCVAYAKRP